MLESLSIRNYAIIDMLTVNFHGGLNVITGETGAGKSIVVDAFELILGARSSTEMIRTGADTLSVIAVFRIDPGMLPPGMPVEVEDGCLMIRRDVRRDGSSRGFVNDVPVTVKTLKELGNILVDLHGQHDHQSLFDPTRHVVFLDAYGELDSLSAAIAGQYRELQSLNRKIAAHENMLDQLVRDHELNRFQLEEIDAAAIRPDEDETLGDELSRLSRATDLKALGMEVFETLSEAEGAVGEQVDALAMRVSHLLRYDSKLEPLQAKIDELSILAKDVAEQFREYAADIDDDPGALAKLEERLALIERLKKKYGPTVADVFAYREELAKKTHRTGEIEEELDKFRNRRDALVPSLIEQGCELTEKRQKAAPYLSREVEAHLAELGMPGARLVVAINPAVNGEHLEIDGESFMIGPDGMDAVEFTFSANPGEPPKPLVKIASGGEISRVMLSLKLALSSIADVPTMVFDEIDNGVSGRVADAIGAKMLALAASKQVLTITHLPQIAVMADCHFSARKRIDGGRTLTDLVMLDREARQTELATLLSGDSLADTALAHAKELMERVDSRRNDEMARTAVDSKPTD